MKGWYILFAEKKQRCVFVSVIPEKGLLILRWPNGQNVRIMLRDFRNEYKKAVSGGEITAFALTKTQKSKTIKIVFK